MLTALSRVKWKATALVCVFFLFAFLSLLALNVVFIQSALTKHSPNGYTKWHRRAYIQRNRPNCEAKKKIPWKCHSVRHLAHFNKFKATTLAHNVYRPVGKWWKSVSFWSFRGYLFMVEKWHEYKCVSTKSEKYTYERLYGTQKK